MSGVETRVDPAGLRAGEPAVRAIASSIGTVLARLDAALVREGACWGADEVGQTFAAAYRPAVATMRQALTDLGDGAAGIADALLTVAANAEQTEGRTRLRFPVR